MGFHSPLPSSMDSECKKCGKILTSFVDARRFGPDRVIPAKVLSTARGLAIITVFKAGLFGSGRFGSGVVVARLPDGSWSTPSAVAIAGTGIGSQVGFELTDFVFVLNSHEAVNNFTQAGSLAFGGSLSLAAGPFGRTVEAAGAANKHGTAAIYSYSKSKGFFAGISLEGSVMAERKGANDKLYGWPYSAKQLLSGAVKPPPAAAPLMEVLKMNVFEGYMDLNIGVRESTLPNQHRETDAGFTTYDDMNPPLVLLTPRPLQSNLETGTMTSQHKPKANTGQTSEERRSKGQRSGGEPSRRQDYDGESSEERRYKRRHLGGQLLKRQDSGREGSGIPF